MRIELKVLNKEFYRVDKLGGSYYDIPDYQTDGAAAIDLVATKDYTIMPGETVAIPTGLALHIGSASGNGFLQGGNYMGMIAPRSGLGSKGLVLANTIGIIDEDYQGEIIIQAWNRTFAFPEKIEIGAGDRFAQLLFVPIIKPQFKIVDEFSSATSRSAGGFGSTDE